MMPAMPTGVSLGVADEAVGRPSPSVRSTPSSVVSRSPAWRASARRAAAGQPVEVVGVGGLAQLEHDVVGGVDDVVDRSHAQRASSRAGDPRRRRPDRDAGEDRGAEARAQVGRSTTDASPGATADDRHGFGAGMANGSWSRAAEVAGHAGDAHGVGPVGLDGEVEHDVAVDAQGLGERPARLEPGRLWAGR